MVEDILIESALTLVPAINSESIVSSTEEARKVRDRLLEDAKSIVTITDEIDSSVAVTTMKELKEFRDRIETLRAEVKAPVLRVGKEIDERARELSSEIVRQYDRLALVLGSYEMAQKRIRDAAAAKANEEAVRVANEAEEAANKIRRDQYQGVSTDTPIQAAMKAEAIEEKATDKLIQIQQSAANVAPKASGTVLRQVIELEITDINELVKHNPTYCKIEANRTVILSVIRQNPNIHIPGLKHWKSSKAGV